MWIRQHRLWLLSLALLATLWIAPLTNAQELIIAPGEPIPLAIISNRQGAAFGEGHVSERGVLLAGEDRPRSPSTARNSSSSSWMAIPPAMQRRQPPSPNPSWRRTAPSPSSAPIAPALAWPPPPLFAEAGFTSLSPSCTAPTLTQQSFRSFHRLVSTDALTAERAARFLYEELGGRRLALALHER